MIRPARRSDAADIYRLVRELADYERSVGQVVASEDDVRRALFGERLTGPALLALAAASGR